MKGKKITLYSLPTCGMCMALKMLLNSKKVNYNLIMDSEELKNNGIDHVPVLEIDGDRYNFQEAMKLIKEN